MLKSLLLTTVLVPGLAAGAHARVVLRAVYSETANAFETMDQVSEWMTGFCDEGYRREWVKRFGPMDALDERFFTEYRTLRARHFSDPGGADPRRRDDGLFARADSLTGDPVAAAFDSSGDTAEALRRLSGLITPAESEFLERFYAHFRARESVLLKESEPLAGVAEAMDKALAEPAYGAYFDAVAAFYRVKADVRYRVVYVWWPPLDSTNSSPSGDVLVMRYNPILHRDAAEKDKDVVFGQMLFLKRFDPKAFAATRSWYRDPWIDAYARRLLPAAEARLSTDKTIADGFIPAAAELCGDAAVR